MEKHTAGLLFLILFFTSNIMAQTMQESAIDTVETISGGIYTGKIIKENSYSLQIKTNDFGVVTINKDNLLAKENVIIKTYDDYHFFGNITYEDSDRLVIMTSYRGPVSVSKSNIKYRGTKIPNNEIRKNALSLNFLGASSIVGITYERLLSESLSVELGGGYIGGGAGFKIYPSKVTENKFMFHSGVTLSYTIPGDGADNILIGYIPIGLSFFGKNDLNFGIDIGPSIMADNSQSIIFFWGNIKLGIRF